MKKAVFLDRDGVITRELGYICPIDNIEVFSYVRDCVKMIHDKGYLAIVITNQSGVARGIFTEKQLTVVNDRIQSETDVDAIYYCPHHPNGIMNRYAIKCACRKPETGLIDSACRDYNIDISKTYMVGDRSSDIICGNKAGAITVLVNSGYGIEGLERGANPDYIMKNLEEFTNWLR